MSAVTKSRVLTVLFWLAVASVLALFQWRNNHIGPDDPRVKQIEQEVRAELGL